MALIKRTATAGAQKPPQNNPFRVTLTATDVGAASLWVLLQNPSPFQCFRGKGVLDLPLPRSNTVNITRIKLFSTYVIRNT